MTTVAAPIWLPTRQFPVRATGPSFYSEALTHLAQNKKGETGICFFIAVLFPDDKSEHDANAVAVMNRNGRHGADVLGHLPRELAAQYRLRMKEAGYSHCVSACEGVLTGGLRTPDREFSFVLELDLDLSGTPSPENEVYHPETVRFPACPPLRKERDGVYRVKCWLPRDAIGALCPKWRTIQWTAENWDTVNYYLLNKSGVGLGFKLLSIPKQRHAGAFGNRKVKAVIESIVDRWVTLRLES